MKNDKPCILKKGVKRMNENVVTHAIIKQLGKVSGLKKGINFSIL